MDQIKGLGARQVNSLLVQSASYFSIVHQRTVQCKEHSVHYSQLAESVAELEPGDWRGPIVNYLKDPSQTRDRKIWRQALKYTLLNDELYHRTIDGLTWVLMSLE